MPRDARVVRPDSKGRIALGSLAKGVSSYMVDVQPDGRIVLTAYAEVPALEKWLFDNPKARESVARGLTESSQGKTQFRGSFAKYATQKISKKR